MDFRFIQGHTRVSSAPCFHSFFLPPNSSCGIQATGFQEELVSTDLIGAVIPRPPSCEEQQANISISCSLLLSFSANSETNMEAMGCFPAAIPSFLKHHLTPGQPTQPQKYLLPLATTRPPLQQMVDQWSHLRDYYLLSSVKLFPGLLYIHMGEPTCQGVVPLDAS